MLICVYVFLLLVEAAQTPQDQTDKTKIPFKRYVVRGCYNQLTGQTATKYVITTNYCFKSKQSTIWNYDGSKSWQLSDGSDPTTTEYIRLCKEDKCNSQKVIDGNKPCVETDQANNIVGDTLISPVSSSKSITVANDC
jgi:hypothetical protein